MLVFVEQLFGAHEIHFQVDLVIGPEVRPTEAVQSVLRELTRAQVIIEYCI